MSAQFRRHENGGICCYSTNAAGERIAPRYPCDKCKAHLSMQEDTTPPHAYERDLQLRAAAERTAAPITFEQRFANMRAREFKLQQDELDKHITTAAASDLSAYDAPDPYARDLKALREAR